MMIHRVAVVMLACAVSAQAGGWFSGDGISVGTIRCTNNATIGGTLTVSNSATIGGSLGVSNSATIGQSLSISNNVFINGPYPPALYITSGDVVFGGGATSVDRLSAGIIHAPIISSTIFTSRYITAAFNGYFSGSASGLYDFPSSVVQTNDERYANALTNETDTLATVLGRGNNANGQSATNFADIQGTGVVAWGIGVNVTNINPTAVGAQQAGYVAGGATIDVSAYGAQQMGFFQGGSDAKIGNTAAGAQQRGRNRGIMDIGVAASGAQQAGFIGPGAVATNNGIGAMQLFDLTAGQNALTTSDGDASLLLGAGTASNRHAIVAGDGQESHGDGSITAGGGFYGSLTHNGQAIMMAETTLDSFGIESTSYPVGNAQTSSVWMGYQTMYGAIGTENAAIGLSAMYQSSGSQNAAFGANALQNSAGSFNAAVGYSSIRDSAGSYNAAVGDLSMYQAAGSENAAVGDTALYISPGSFNSALGSAALRQAAGSYNVAVGYKAGRLSSGISNVFLGASSAVSSPRTNAICLGAGSAPLGDNSMVLGNPQTAATMIYGNTTNTGSITAGGGFYGPSATLTATLTASNIVQTAGGWDDLLFPVSSIYAVGLTDIEYLPQSNSINFKSTCNTNFASDNVWLVGQLSHSTKTNAAYISPHIHFVQTSATQTNQFLVRYKRYKIGDAVPTTWTDMPMSSNVFAYTSGTIHQIADNGNIDAGPSGFGISENFDFKIWSRGGEATQLKFFDIHFMKDGLGSDQEYQKTF